MDAAYAAAETGDAARYQREGLRGEVKWALPLEAIHGEVGLDDPDFDLPCASKLMC
jgi:hypothetical protein